MTGSNGALSVPLEHLPGLVALVALPIVVWIAICAVGALGKRRVAWAEVVGQRFERMSFGARVALFGSLAGAIVHAALVPTHWTADHVIALLFIADAVGFAIAFVWILTGRRYWHSVALTMLGGTTAGYAWYLLTGRETLDLVGLLTTTVELAAALVVVSSAASAVGSRWSVERWITPAAVAVALFSMLGTSAIASASPASSSTTSTASSQAKQAASHGNGTSGQGMEGMTGASAGSRSMSLPTTSPAGSVTWPVDMTTMAAGMQMATPNCTAEPTVAQQKAAVNLVDQTVATATPYKSLAAAKAAGYIPVTPPGQKVVHYINPSIYRQGPVLDPNNIPVLVYVNTSHGAVLSAAMYLVPQSSAAARPPQPGGCLTQWHIHSDLCFSAGRVVGNINAGACSAGSFNQTTQPMMHVWLTSVSGGPLAPDLPAVDQVVTATQVPALNPPNGTA
jgi:hypothetical protein